MKKFSLFILTASLLVLLSPHTVKSDTADTVNTLRSFKYENVTKLDNMDRFARDEAGKFLNTQFKEQAKGWTDQARNQWVKEKGEHYQTLGIGSLAQHTPWEKSPEYRNFLKGELKNRMKLEFPKQVNNFIRNELLKGDGQKMDAQAKADMTQMVAKISGHVMGDVEGVVNQSIDQWGSEVSSRHGMFGSLGAAPESPTGFLDSMSNKLASKMGDATKEGMKDFINTKMFQQFGKDYDKKIEGQMKSAADKIEDMGEMDMESLKGAAGLDGNIDVNDVEGMLKSVMEDNPLGGLGASDYMEIINPDQYLAKFANDAKALNATRLQLFHKDLWLPSPLYAGILLGAAASHFGRCCGFLYFRWWEIERGIRLIRSAIWQMGRERSKGYLLLGGDIGGRGLLEGHGSYFDSDKLDNLEKAIKKVSELTEKTGEKEAKKILDEVFKDMASVKKDLDQAVLDLKNKQNKNQAQFAKSLDKVQAQQKQDIKKSADRQKELDACSNPLTAPNPAKCGFKPVKPATSGVATAMSVGGGSGGKGFNDLVCKASPMADASSKLDPVVLYSGEFKLDATDLKVKGRGIDFEFSRHYRNQWERLGSLGYNWTHNYDEKVLEDENTGDLLHQTPSGLIYQYSKKDENVYQSPAGIFAALKKVEPGYLLESEEHELRHFNKKGQLVKIEDRHGNALRFEYGLSGEQIVLTRVVDTLERPVEFRYDTQGLLTSITDSFGREVVYTYDREKDLVSVRSPVSADFPQGKTVRYRYSGGKLEPSLNHNITLIMDPKGQIYLRNEYGTEGFEKDRLTAQIFGEKESQRMTASYQAISETGGANTAASKTIVTDRKGTQHEYVHNARGLRLSYRGEKYLYNDDDQLILHTYPSGREEIFVYDSKNENRAAQSNLLEYWLRGVDKKEAKIQITYDDANHLATSRTLVGKDPQGNEVTRREEYTTTPLGMPKEVKKGDLTTLYEYNPQGQLAAVSEGSALSPSKGNWRRSYFYDKENLIQVTENDGVQTRSIQLAYDKYGNVTEVTDPSGAKTRYWLNAANLVVQKEDALENKSYYKYDENNNLVEVVAENKGGANQEELGYELRERYTFDSLDHLVKKEVQVNRDSWAAETYTYDTGENLAEITDLRGIKHGFAYDDHDRLIEETLAGETVRKLNYDKDGLLIAEIDGLGGKKTYQWDSLARITQFTDPAGTQLKIDYNPVGEIAGYQVWGRQATTDKRPASAKATAGKPATSLRQGYGGQASDQLLLKEVQLAYDALGRKTGQSEKKIGSEEWLPTTYVYEGRHLKEVKDNLGLVRSFAYNGFGELSAMNDAAGNSVNVSYDPRGLVSQKEIKKGLLSLVEKVTYDALGRPKSQSDADGNTTEWSYDSIGNRIRQVDPLKRETLLTYDGLGRLLTETEGERVRRLEWSPEGFIAKFVDGMGKAAAYTYDARGRKKTETGPDGLMKQYDYDVMDKLVKLSVGDEVYSYKYDVAGRMIERLSQSGLKQNYAYDGLGRLIESVDSNNPSSPDDDVKTSFTYDSLNHLIREASRGYLVQKDYDARGRMAKLVYPSGEVVERKFDEAGWLTSVVAGGKTIGSYDYALLGFPQKEMLGNGITRELSYDKLMQVVEENYTLDRKKLSQMAYHYDPLGRVVLKGNLTDRKWDVYDYNNLDQLTRVGTAQGLNIARQGALDSLKTSVWNASRSRREYAYDFEGQWQEILKTDGGKTTQTPIAQGDGYRYDQFGDEQMTYDARGNLVGYGEKLFEYDAWNRLIRVRDKASNKVTASYLYDAHNRRVQKTIHDPQSTIHYVYDNWSLIEEYTDKQLHKLYFHGRKLDEPVAVKSGDELYFYHRDRMGSVVALSDSKGVLAGSYEYGEYGQLNDITRQGPKLASADPKNPVPASKIPSPDFAYTGQYYDAESGLYYYKNRYYSPEIGHFLSQDPLGMVNGPNVYTYVTNDPLNWIDPMGTEKGRTRGWMDIANEKLTYATGYMDAWNPLTPAFDWMDEKIFGSHRFSGQPYEDVYWEARGLGKQHATATLDVGQTGLDIVGLVPVLGEPADALNAGIYAVRGDMVNAGLSTAALWPAGGQAATVAKLGLKYGDDVVGVAQFGAKHGDEATALLKKTGLPQKAPDFVVTPKGNSIPIPDNAVGPFPTKNDKGFMYTGGSGGKGMDPRVSDVRIMDPTKPFGPSPGYEGGYVNYMNKYGQSVNPVTGQTISKTDPLWHIPLKK